MATSRAPGPSLILTPEVAPGEVAVLFPCSGHTFPLALLTSDAIAQSHAALVAQAAHAQGTELPDSQASEVNVDRLVGTHQGGAASLRYPGIAVIVGCTILAHQVVQAAGAMTVTVGEWLGTAVDSAPAGTEAQVQAQPRGQAALEDDDAVKCQ
jgi:hypothetical protein